MDWIVYDPITNNVLGEAHSQDRAEAIRAEFDQHVRVIDLDALDRATGWCGPARQHACCGHGDCQDCPKTTQ